MIELEKNQRRIPSDTTFVSNKEVVDLLYGLIQLESNRTPGENHRYIRKNRIKKTKWAKICGVSRPTLDKALKKLITDGYLIECEDEKDFYRIPNKSEYYVLVPIETLSFLVNSCSLNTIKIFMRLNALWNHYRTCAYFTKTKLISDLGLNPKWKGNFVMINDILKNLENNGFVEYVEKKNGINSRYFITNFDCCPSKIKSKE